MKNLSTMHKRVIGVTFTAIVLALFVYMQPVKALEYCKSSSGQEEQATESELVGRYGISAVQGEGNKYTLSMNPSSNKTERCKMKFTLESVNDETKNLELTCDKPIELVVNSVVTDTDSGLESVRFIITGKDIKKNENQSNSCYYKKGKLMLEITASTTETVHEGSCPTVEKESADISVAYIDCSKTYEAGSFQAKFCNAKNKAIAAGKSYSEGHGLTNGRYSGTIDDLTFKCDSDIKNIPTKPEDLEGDKYFLNKKYIYGSYTKSYDMGHYSIHHAPGVEVEGDAIVCEITCEEAVEVEFGPPVASHAGACFEYKVRVTSRVSCNMSKTPEPPPADCSYKTPTPYCVHYDGSVYLQGGPNEQFDACVKSCDGGKYSKKCSNKCYKQVYGKAKTNKKLNNEFMNDVVNASKLAAMSAEECFELKDANGNKYNPTGCYVVSGSSILWKHPGSNHVEGRWYTEHPGGAYHNGSYILAQDDGFWRRNYGNDYCHDNCSWIGDYTNYYLNPGMAEKDYVENMEKYNEAIKGCRSKATCKTEKAEFTISADYTKKGETTVTHIDFPYESDPDFAKHEGDAAYNSAANQGTTLLIDYPSEGNGIWGCYKNGAPEKNLYRTTWGFPGSWKNLKTGEITFVPVNDADVWYTYSHQFCIPGDAKSVNPVWWNAYKHKELDDSATVTGSPGAETSYTDPDIVERCKGFDSAQYSVKKINYNVYSAYVFDGAPLTYNIHAIAKEFGYFGWNIKMDCFYAINDDPICLNGCCLTGSCTTDELIQTYGEDCNPSSGYRIRSTELTDLFPDPEGEETATPDSSGRTTGYNWSEYAYNTKNPNYTSNPVKYMTEVQQNARSAKTAGVEYYSENTLDYEFNLSPKTLRDMRKDAAGLGGSNYTAFEDSGFNIDQESGVGRYKSEKIRLLAGDNKIPSLDSQLRCNNMINWSTDGCNPVHN